jgi:hypothetical protein
MSQEAGRTEVQRKTRQLLDGPLKHIRGAALAAALLPLASVAVAPASAQTLCQNSAGVCGTVWNDVNDNGVQDVGEPGIENVTVVACQVCDGSDNITTETDANGYYSFQGIFANEADYTIFVLIPIGMQPSPTTINGIPTESVGIPNGLGQSFVTLPSTTGFATDFGFFTTLVQQPGTGTPGYWKNHADAWPVSNITVGGVSYTKAQAIAWLEKVGKDKTTTMFSSLVSAMLNVTIGNDGSCVNSTIVAANTWTATYGPVGSGVAASSYAWSVGSPLQVQLDSYDNGLLCAPHRQ